MKSYEQDRAVPSNKICMEIHEHFKTPVKIKRHCEKVASVAVSMADVLIKKGCSLDVKKIKSAALLHDIVRYKKNHAAEGAILLDDLGFTGISLIVKAHMEPDEYDMFNITEKSIVYLADKLVSGDSIISLEERFYEKTEIYQIGGQAYKAVEKRYKQAQQVENMIKQLINGESYLDKL